MILGVYIPIYPPPIATPLCILYINIYPVLGINCLLQFACMLKSVKQTTVSQKTGPLQLISRDFTSSRIIFGRDRPYFLFNSQFIALESF